MFKRCINIFLIIIVALFCCGCIAKSVSQKGHIFDDEDLSYVSVGLTNRENALKYLGYPLNKSYFDDNVWIYYSYKMREVMFFKPSIREQRVLVVEFDSETDIIKDIVLYNVNSDKFKILEKESEKDEYKENVIKDILKNIGQVSM